MIREEKERLDKEVKSKHWRLRLIMGIRSIFKDLKKALLLGLYVVMVFLIFHFRNEFFTLQNEDLIKYISNMLFQILIPFWGVMGLFFLLVAFGTPFGSKSVRDNLWRIGLNNHVGESPILIAKYRDLKDKRMQVMEFESIGIPLNEWQDKQTKIEAALNIHVVKITEGKNKRRILLYSLPVKNGLPETVIWKDEYISKENFVLVLGESLVNKVTVNLGTVPHILIGGATGSGKSILLKSLIMQCVIKGATVYIADFKGGVDFPIVWHKHCTIVTEENNLLELLTMIAEELNHRMELFLNMECVNIDNYNSKTGNSMQRIVFACDEVAEILDKTGLDKVKKEVVINIESKLSTIARLGRAFGIHLILATQRPDATIISGQIRNNINYRICGRADNVLSQIILDNTSASDKIPKDAQGRFITHDGTVFQGYWFDDTKAFECDRGSLNGRNY